MTDSTRVVECSGCDRSWEEEIWRSSDGPCADGKWYCLRCLAEDKCGCVKEIVAREA